MPFRILNNLCLVPTHVEFLNAESFDTYPACARLVSWSRVGGPVASSCNLATVCRTTRLMRFSLGMGNQNSALLEAAAVGNVRKARQLLDKCGSDTIDWKGQVVFLVSLTA